MRMHAKLSFCMEFDMTDGDLILVVDDEPPIRTILKYLLEKDGFRVALAGCGEDALAWLHDHTPDLILLDVMMPGLDGFTVLERMRGQFQTSNIPVIMLTARGDTPQRVRGLQGGANDYLTKPFIPDELILRVRNMLQLSRGQRDANPLTGLPGNRAIEHELGRRLDSGQPFGYLYIDLDNFKAYNDYYGYSRGDRVIVLLAETVNASLLECAADGTFVGHVGGDDFVVLTAANHADNVGEAIKRIFDERIRLLYEPEDWERGYIEVQDRTDAMQKFSPVSVTIAVLGAVPGQYEHLGKLNSVMAELKKYGKTIPGSVVVRDRRTPGDGGSLVVGVPAGDINRDRG